MGSDTKAAEAFYNGIARLGTTYVGGAGILPQEQCMLEDIDKALQRLAQLNPVLKKKILEGCVACCCSNNQIIDEESQLVRTIAAALGCPHPPIYTGMAL